MSIVINRSHRVVDLQKWHMWFPWVPIRLTEKMEDSGLWSQWRWLVTVERRVDQTTFGYPRIPIRWEYRDIGARWFQAEMKYA